MKAPAGWILLMLLACLAGGCVPQGPAARNVSLATWQRSIERYVTEEGNGDAGVLRESRLPDGQRGFLQMGNVARAGASDASGLLLGHPAVAGRRWFVYLVGFIRNNKLRDIRLVGLCVQADDFDWRISPPAPEAVRAYQMSQTSERAESAAIPESEATPKLATTPESAGASVSRGTPGSADTPALKASPQSLAPESAAALKEVQFPGSGDRFEMRVSSGRVTVGLSGSDAQWTLDLTLPATLPTR